MCFGRDHSNLAAQQWTGAVLVGTLRSMAFGTGSKTMRDHKDGMHLVGTSRLRSSNFLTLFDDPELNSNIT